MKPFMDKDFLLGTDIAKTLYHEHAAKVPIIDYHCHINPMEIALDKQYTTITEIWLGGHMEDGRLSKASRPPGVCRSTCQPP